MAVTRVSPGSAAGTTSSNVIDAIARTRPLRVGQRAALEQLAGETIAEEPGAAGDHHVHGRDSSVAL